MEMIIRDDRSLRDIKTEFNSWFPHLKLEFFMHRHLEGQGSPEEEMIPDTATIKGCRLGHTEGVLTITPEMSVSDLEGSFYVLFGLMVQVYRQSGKDWVQTTVSDKHSLAEQNKRSEGSSSGPQTPERE